MAVWQPRIPPHLADAISHLPPAVKRELRQALRVLSNNPHAGAPLKRELQGLWKFRIRSFRIVYKIVPTERLLQIVAVGHRKTVYDLIRR